MSVSIGATRGVHRSSSGSPRAAPDRDSLVPEAEREVTWPAPMGPLLAGLGGQALPVAACAYPLQRADNTLSRAPSAPVGRSGAPQGGDACRGPPARTSLTSPWVTKEGRRGPQDPGDEREADDHVEPVLGRCLCLSVRLPQPGDASGSSASGQAARDRRQSEPLRAHVVLEGRLMAQRPQRPQRPKPVPIPPPVAHEIPCTCDACLVLDAVRFVEEEAPGIGPPRHSRLQPA
jgi:hypothetical protein